MRGVALSFKLVVAGAGATFLAVSAAGAHSPHLAADPQAVKEVPVSEKRAKELDLLRHKHPSPTPSPTRPSHSPSPTTEPTPWDATPGDDPTGPAPTTPTPPPGSEDEDQDQDDASPVPGH